MFSLHMLGSVDTTVSTDAANHVLEKFIGHYHATFFHILLALLIAALVSDILAYYGKLKSFTLGNCLIISALIVCIPSILTGIAASVNFNHTDYFYVKHQFLGYATGVSCSLYAGLRISAMWWKLPLLPIHYVILSIMMVALVLWTSDFGALLAKGISIKH